MNTERRSAPRLNAFPCQWCDSTRASAHHARDAGDLTPAEAYDLGYCPELAARRNGIQTTTLAPTDARIAARMDAAPELDADEMAALYAFAMSSETL